MRLREETVQPVVLVIDDDDDIRWLVGDILAAHGYGVASAGGGAEALERLAEGLRPDLVVLDLMMPGMSGWEFAGAMRRDPALAAVPLVLISAFPEHVRGAAQELNAAGFLDKPFGLTDILRVVRRCAAPSRAARPEPARG